MSEQIVQRVNLIYQEAEKLIRLLRADGAVKNTKLIRKLGYRREIKD